MENKFQENLKSQFANSFSSGGVREYLMFTQNMGFMLSVVLRSGSATKIRVDLTYNHRMFWDKAYAVAQEMDNNNF